MTYAFTKYWAGKAQKRRKSWVAKAKRYAEQHTQLEDIRKEVFLPIDYTAGFELDDYKVPHYTKTNPIVVWNQGQFEFSESGLRQAMEAKGADMSSFKMEVSRQSIVGKEAPEPKVWGYCQNVSPNKVYDNERDYHAWLKRIYEICTEVQTCKLTYGQVTMIIRRYTTEGIRFAYYEVIPCEQLVKSAMLMEETSFNRLNIATLLMEMAAEYELRQEEMTYHAKKLKLRTMEAVTFEGIDFELWDDKKLEKKLKEYVEKDYSLFQVFDQVFRPWKTAIKKYIETVTERDNQNNREELVPRHWAVKPDYIERHLRPYLDSVGLQDVKVWLPNEKSTNIYFEYKGFLAKYHSYDKAFYPNAHYGDCSIRISVKTTLSAIAGYLKMMPDFSQRTDEIVIKTMRLYDQMMMQHNEHYRTVVEALDPLTTQYAGTPVGKLLKYMRWEAGRLLTSKLPLSSIKIINDRAFSYMEKDVLTQATLTPNGLTSTHEDITYERWLDPDCRIVYKEDPVTTDIEKRMKANPYERWSWDVPSFISSFFLSRDSYVSHLLSAEFFDQKL